MFSTTFVRHVLPVAFCVLAGTSLAAAAPARPSWFHYVWSIPIIKGEYMPADGGTLGTLGLTYTDDARHTFGVTTSYFNASGVPVTDATGGVITFNDDDSLRSTGVIASTPITFFHMTNGPCRGCADRPRTQTATADVGKFEWTSPRSGRYTLNGQTQVMVEAVSGPPLVAATDFSGRWLLATRRDFSDPATPESVNHFEAVSYVDLTPVTQPRSYTVATVPGLQTGGDMGLPPPGARLYDVTCTVAATIADPIAPCHLEWFGYKLATEYTLWFDDNNVGHLIAAKAVGGTRTVYDTGSDNSRVYGISDRIVGRKPYVSSGIISLIEFSLFRAGNEVSAGGTWTAK